MIKKITIKHFKKFKDASYEVNPAVSLLVGPNNGGKTTALQAISLWSSLIQEWNEKKGKASGSTAKKRSGAQVTRNAIYAVPVQEMKFLWFNTLTQSAKQQKISIQIIAEGADKEGKAWEYGVELNYGGPEVLYCKPMDLKKDIPDDVNKVSHLPPLSGVQTQERKVELGLKDILLEKVGQERFCEICFCKFKKKKISGTICVSKLKKCLMSNSRKFLLTQLQTPIF